MTTNTPPCEVGWGGAGWDDAAAAVVDEPGIGWGGEGWAEQNGIIVPVTPPSPLLACLISYWKLEEAAGAVRADSVVASGNDLGDNNMAGQTAGILGNAANFVEASNQALTRASNASLSAGDIDYTWAAWCYLHTKGGNRTVVGKWAAGAPDMDYLIRFESGSNKMSFWNATALSEYKTVTAANFGSPPLDTWFFVVAWRDAAAGKIYIQVNDGVPNYADALTAVTNAYDVSFGWSATGTNNWDGAIDEVGFWKCKLDASERTMLYNNGAGITYPLTLPLTLDGLTFEGDSLTAGSGQGETTWAPQLISDLYPAPTTSVRSWNVATMGHNVSAIAASQGAETDVNYGVLFERNLAFLWAGVNDLLTTADSAATIEGNISTWCLARQAAGFKVIVFTILPSNYGTKPPDFDTRRAALNNLLLANWASYADAIVDVGNNATLSDPNDTTYYFSDKLHLKTVGHAIVETMVKAAIAGL